MLVFKYLLMTLGGGMFVAGIGVAAYDLWLGVQYQRKVNAGVESAPPEPVRWRTTVALCSMAWAPILVALSFIMVPSGMAGVRISQTRGTEPGTLYPGVHGVIPLLEHVELFDMRDKLYTTFGDAEAVAEMIRVYRTRFDAFDQPLFLAGESYGWSKASKRVR